MMGGGRLDPNNNSARSVPKVDGFVPQTQHVNLRIIFQCAEAGIMGDCKLGLNHTSAKSVVGLGFRIDDSRFKV